MTNPDNIPALSICRPVLNIGQAEHIDPLQASMVEAAADSEAARDLVRGMFDPAHGLYAAIITEGEFVRIQNRLGEDRLGEQQVRQLANRMLETLASRPEEVEAETLPPKVLNWGNWPKRSLWVAMSPAVIKDRRSAKQVMFDFLGRDVLDAGWFNKTRKVVPVRLATSRTAPGAMFLEKATEIIGQNGTLPAVTELGMIEVRVAGDPTPRYPRVAQMAGEHRRNGDRPGKNG